MGLSIYFPFHKTKKYFFAIFAPITFLQKAGSDLLTGREFSKDVYLRLSLDFQTSQL